MELRRQLAALFDRMGGIHIQIGKYYAYEANMDPQRWQVLQALKGALDPGNLININPGSLGFKLRENR